MKNRKLEDTNQTRDMKQKLHNTKWKLRDTKLKDTTVLRGLKCDSSKEMLEHKVTCLTHHLKKVETNSFVWKKISSKLVKVFAQERKRIGKNNYFLPGLCTREQKVRKEARSISKCFYIISHFYGENTIMV